MSVALMVEINPANNSIPVKVQVNAPLTLDTNAPVAHDEYHERLKQSVLDIDTDLECINEVIEDAISVINELEINNIDITIYEESLNLFKNDKEEILAEKETLENIVLENTNSASGIEEVSENLGSFIPEKDALTLCLENVAKNLAASDVSSSDSVSTTSDKSKALEKVASLLHEGNSDTDNIIKTIEGREDGEHVANPNKPNTSDDVNNDIAVNRYIPGYMPDANNHIILDYHDYHDEHETYVV